MILESVLIEGGGVGGEIKMMSDVITAKCFLVGFEVFDFSLLCGCKVKPNGQ